MAEYKQGDRVVKMSGVCAGKYGTVNSVREDGTLNVTFDGERLPRFCDPEKCGAVAANRRAVVTKDINGLHAGQEGEVESGRTPGLDMVFFKVGKEKTSVPPGYWTWADKANSRAANAAGFDNPYYDPAAGMKYLDTHFQMFDPKVAKAMIEDARRKGVKVPPGVLEKARKAGIVANAKFKVGDRVISKEYPELGEMKVVRVFQDIHGTAYRTSRDGYLTDDIYYDRTLIPANSRAANAAQNAVARNDMWVLEKGDRVKIKRTGETGVVTHVYNDGAISVMRDNGVGTILDKRELEWIG